MNWLQVSVSTKPPEIEERESEKFETEMVILLGLKAQQQAFEFILPGKGAFHDEAQFVERVIKEAGASPFGLLTVARIFFDVGLEPRLKTHLRLALLSKP